jgi:hypothetical protein
MRHTVPRVRSASVEELTPEQFTQPVAGSHGTIRNAMVDVLSAEWGWLGRCGGSERGAPLNPLDHPTVASLVDIWHFDNRTLAQHQTAICDPEVTPKYIEEYVGEADHLELRKQPHGRCDRRICSDDLPYLDQGRSGED